MTVKVCGALAVPTGTVKAKQQGPSWSPTPNPSKLTCSSAVELREEKFSPPGAKPGNGEVNVTSTLQVAPGASYPLQSSVSAYQSDALTESVIGALPKFLTVTLCGLLVAATFTSPNCNAEGSSSRANDCGVPNVYA